MSLFTFSSNSIQRKVMYIAIAFFVAWIISYTILWLHQGDKRIGYFAGFLPKNAKQVPLNTTNLVVGDSTCGTGMNEKYFFENTENLSMGAGDFVVALQSLKNAIKRVERLDRLIICYDNLMFFVNSTKARKGDFRRYLRSGIEWYQVPETSFGEKVTFLLKYNWPIISLFFSNEKIAGDDLLKLIHSKPQKKKVIFKFKPQEGKEKLKSYDRKYRKRNSIKRNKKALAEILQIASELNSKVYFVRMPVTPEFRNNRSEWWIKKHEDFKNFAKSIMGGDYFHYIDLSASEKDMKYFGDPNHLTKEGEIINTKKLKNIIEKLKLK